VDIWIVQRLFWRQGPDPDVLFGTGQRIMNTAVFRGEAELVQLMLDKGSGVNGADSARLSP
jgi:hypothetical protein